MNTIIKMLTNTNQRRDQLVIPINETRVVLYFWYDGIMQVC